MHKARLKSIFNNYIAKRNKQIINLRKKGKSLKFISAKFGLTIRHISRVITKEN